MARPLRIEYPGAIYHVTSRGNARLPIYQDYRDRLSFLSVLKDVVERYQWRCHAYCLMENHYHLLVETPEGNLSKGMRQLNGVYTQRFNRRHGKVGHVFQGRFKAILVDRDAYLLELCRYVVLNPVRAATVVSPERYRWSSYRATAGFERAPLFLTRDWILAQFGENRRSAESRYREFVVQGIREASPWSQLVGQLILGRQEFIEHHERFVAPKSAMKEIPRGQRFASRPTLERLFSPENVASRPRRDRAISNAHRWYGYSLAEIGRHLGLHYTTISKVVNQPSR